MTKQNKDEAFLNITTSQALVKLKPEIERRWLESIRKNVEGARSIAEPVLFNYIPVLLDSLGDALNPQTGRSNATDGTSAAQEHGGERFRLTSFEVADLVTELQILKTIVYATLEEKITLGAEDRLGIERSIDSVIKDTVSGFVITESHFREQYTAMLAHDIRNPLSFIVMAANVLINGIGGDQNVTEIYQRILNNAKRADRLIQNILDAHVVKERGSFKLDLQSTNILDLIRHCAGNWQGRVRVQGEAIIGYWSPNELSRSLENLIENADKYGAKDSPITVSVETSHGSVLLRVHNEGKPIPLEEQENIFKPLHRAKEAQNRGIAGWGFGLPIVRAVAEAHGGSIHVESAPEKGTTFLLMMPIDARPFKDAPTIAVEPSRASKLDHERPSAGQP